MLEVYFSVAVMIGASLLVGRAVTLALCRPWWTGLEAALGLALIVTVAGVLARFPGRANTIAIGLALLGLIGLAVIARYRLRAAAEGEETVEGSDIWTATLTGIIVAAVLSIPFLISGHWGVIGVGVNNDMGLHLAWTEWLRSGLGPVPDGGYPLGPHGLVATVSRAPGISSAQAFAGLLITIGVITALTALAALRPRREADPGPAVGLALPTGRRVLAACMVALPYLAVSYFAQSAFKETIEALFVLTFTLALPLIGSAGFGRWRILALVAVPAGGIVFSYSFAGLAWPVAIGGLWLLTRAEFWRTLRRPRRLAALVFSPFTLCLLAGLAVAAYVLFFTERYGFSSGFSNVAGSNTYGPVSPLQALGVWPESNYRLASTGWPAGTIAFAAIGILALGLTLYRLLRERLYLLPTALAAAAIVYLGSLPVSGDYSRAKALMIVAPLVMMVIAPTLLAGPGRSLGRAGIARGVWAVAGVCFLGLAAYSSFLVLRDIKVAPGGHGDELQSFMPWIAGEPVLYAGQDRYAAYNLRGADAVVPLVEFPDHRVKESVTKPWDTGSAYSPIDFDSFDADTLNRFPWVITGSAAWNSGPPDNFEEVTRTDSFILWRRTGRTPPGRMTLIEGTSAAASVDCAHPEMAILSELPGQASLFPTPVIARRDNWAPSRFLLAGDHAEQTLQLPAGEWRLSLQYFAPRGIELTAPGLSTELIPALDGQRPSTISLANDGQFWPAGELVVEQAGPVTFRVQAPEPSSLQRLLGHRSPVHLGNLVAVPVGQQRKVPLSEVCGSWVDWYRGGSAAIQDN